MYLFKDRPRQTKNIKLDAAVYICCKFVKEPIDFGNNVRMAKQLIKQYPNIEFWENLDIGRQLNNLSFFLCSEGQILLDKTNKIKDITFNEPEKFELSDKKIEDNVKVENNKKKNLVEFLS